MREIEFRGQKKDSGLFVFGDLILSKPNKVDGQYSAWIINRSIMPFGLISTPSENFIPVKPETVGQFTGLEDKNGVKIFEGDIIESYVDPSIKIKHIVQWSYGHKGWFMKNINNIYSGSVLPGDIQLWVYINNARLSDGKKIHQVIGNIHQNPELLK